MKKLLFLTYFLSAACFGQTYEVTFKNETPEYITINSEQKNKLEIASGLGCYQSIEFFKDYFELKLCMHYFTVLKNLFKSIQNLKIGKIDLDLKSTVNFKIISY